VINDDVWTPLKSPVFRLKVATGIISELVRNVSTTTKEILLQNTVGAKTTFVELCAFVKLDLAHLDKPGMTQ
jgi:hypothetical protein